MIGYTLLVFIALVTVVLGSVVVFVAIRGWNQEKKAALDVNDIATTTIEN